jgi:chemotaxis receptor (MCP) glutamine deamidase CheD
MQNLSAQATEYAPKEIRVGTNQCRIARSGERLVARAVLDDVVVTVQVPSVGFAAMLRFGASPDAEISSPRLDALRDFADQALAMILESIQSIDIPAGAIRVSAIGGADIGGNQMASVVREILEQHGVVLNGSDLGGMQTRGIWLDSSSGRLIVRSTNGSPASVPSRARQQAVVFQVVPEPPQIPTLSSR